MFNKKNINHRVSLIIIFSFLFTLFFSFTLLAAEKTAGEYLLKADQISFLKQDNLILFEKNASFSSQDFIIESDKIIVDRRKKTVRVPVDLVIYSDKNDLYGQSLIYNYQSGSGELYGAEGSVGELNFSGKKLKLLATSPVEAEMEAAQFTPCMHKEPHYHFKAGQIKIKADNSLDIYNIVPYIWKIPVFYLPYYSAEYNPEKKNPLTSALPVPKLGYDSDRGLTAEFNYPYQINDKNSGKINYLTEGREYDRYERRDITNKHKLTENLTFKNRYYYLYDYDIDDEELDDYEKEFFSSLLYSKTNYSLEAGLGRNLKAAENKNRYFFSTHYNFANGLNTSLRQEYNFDWDIEKESYILSHNRYAVNWKLKYISGEDYNYYPYLNLSLPRFYGLKTSLGSGRVENYGRELNKDRVNLNYNFAHSFNKKLSYHLGYNYRFDHYRSDFNDNYHYTLLNTGFKYQKKLSQKIKLKSSLFYQEDTSWGQSPLPDDREDEEKLLKPTLSFNVQRDIPATSYSITSAAIYDYYLNDWDEINLRYTDQRDCFSYFINYEFVDDSISFGIEI